MFKLIKKYFGIEKTERKILNRTFFWLMYAFVLVRCIPLRWFNSWLGEFKPAGLYADKVDPEGGIETEVQLNNQQMQLINLFRKNLRRLKKVLPWHVKCFEEAIAGKKVLNKYHIKAALFLGVKKDNGTNLEAHAWLKTGSVFVTGEKGYKKYSIVGTYS